jgi:chorismate-pyruvate lyase
MSDGKYGDTEAHYSIEFFFFQKLIFDILLRTDGRTTDILETVMDDQMTVRVLSQEQLREQDIAANAGISGAPFYKRESILVSEKSNFVVSHNIALVCSKHVPAEMFEALSGREEGIGKTISKLGLHTSRRLYEIGWKSAAEADDLFRKPFKPQFSRGSEKIPFKKYGLYFGTDPGIYMVEYFNPNMVRYRLERALKGKEDAKNA